MLSRKQAKVQLKQKGWSYRKVAPHLGVSFVHLAFVLSGRRRSRRLMQKIAAIPPRAELEALANQPSAQSTPSTPQPTTNQHNP